MTLSPACLANAQNPLERMRSIGCVVCALMFATEGGVTAFTGVDKPFESARNVTIKT